MSRKRRIADRTSVFRTTRKHNDPSTIERIVHVKSDGMFCAVTGNRRTTRARNYQRIQANRPREPALKNTHGNQAIAKKSGKSPRRIGNESGTNRERIRNKAGSKQARIGISSGRNQTAADRRGNGLMPIHGPEFALGVIDMKRDGMLRDLEDKTDLPCRLAARSPQQAFDLARRFSRLWNVTPVPAMPEMVPTYRYLNEVIADLPRPATERNFLGSPCCNAARFLTSLRQLRCSRQNRQKFYAFRPVAICCADA